MRQSRAATMFQALSPAAVDGDDVAIKLRSRISMASRAGMCSHHQNEMADEMLSFFFVHLDHTEECPFHATSVRTWQQLVNIGLVDANIHINNPMNH